MTEAASPGRFQYPNSEVPMKDPQVPTLSSDDFEDMDLYQRRAGLTAIFPPEVAMEYLTLGLVGEAGEVANKVKKLMRGDYEGDPLAAVKAHGLIVQELGDILWYVAILAEELDTPLSVVAVSNLLKLSQRHNKNLILGSGDERGV